MSDIAGDLQRRLANIVRRGVIHSIQTGNVPKCRVDLGEIVTAWLPLCQNFAGKNRADFNPYAVGDAVTVLSEAGELNNGRVFPGWNTGAMPVPEASDSEHVTRYGDGTEVRYDQLSHALTITLAQNGTYTIKGEGRLEGNVVITKSLTVEEDTEVRGKIEADGDVSSGAEVSDSKGRMSSVREIFNTHEHNENGDGGGVTDAPNQQM